MLLWVEQSNLLVHGHGVGLTRKLPAQAVDLNPLHHVVPSGGDALPGLLGRTDKQQQLDLQEQIDMG